MDRRIDRAATRLIDMRRAMRQLDSLDADDQPRSLEEGYDTQRVAIANWPDRVAEWKVGATSREIQKLFGIAEPVYGPVFKQTVFESPATVDAHQFSHRLLESEFTFRFGQRLQPRESGYSRADVLGSIDALFPSLELVNPRFTSLTVRNIPQLVADFCANGGAVLGHLSREWQALDLYTLPVCLSINGQERQRGTGALVLGDPVNVLEWFVNRITGDGQSIEAGQFVMTGTMTELHAPPVGSIAAAQFGPLGEVSVTFR